ncbi:hypothetical protein AURDEDRAFT_175409 [Auricularia subglabra TFB-10046 SS5]|nr:hypothetical protein AURDEDRAFT_175409 [Auricularia subglabra TFB-10046 SS5]
MAWFDGASDAALAFLEIAEPGNYHLSAGLKRAIEKMCETESLDYQCYLCGVHPGAQKVVESVTQTKNQLCQNIFNVAAFCTLIAELQQKVLELRAWKTYEQALMHHRRLV